MKNKKNEICPVCEEAMGGTGYELCDGRICLACRDKMRFAYPITYVPNPHPQQRRRPDLEEVFPGENLTSRQKADLIEELRELPLNRADPNPKRYYTVDRMHGLDVEEFAEQSARADAIRNDLLRRFDDYDNVCTVGLTEPVPRPGLREGIPKIRSYYQTRYCAGMVRLGRFRVGDTLSVLRGGREIAQVDLIEANLVEGCLSEGLTGICFSGSVREVVEGHQACLILSPEAEIIRPGDLLVMDD